MINNDLFIRAYQAGDKSQVQKICLCTGPEGIWEQKEMQNILLTAFCNYYIDHEPHNCFVASDAEKIVGYILCAENSVVWADWLRNNYIAQMEESPLIAFYKGIMKAPLKYADEYPAHLHIDILPDYQHMGIGSKLLDTLISHLKSKGLPGIMLSVAGDNLKGIKFYEKYGFSALEETPQEIVMAIDLK